MLKPSVVFVKFVVGYYPENEVSVVLVVEVSPLVVPDGEGEVEVVSPVVDGGKGGVH